MLKRILLATLLFASQVGAQSLSQLPRATVPTGLNDSTLIQISDSARRTRAAIAPDFRKMLSLRAFDSLVTANLRLTGTVNGTPTWASQQLFASGQRVDSATGAARASGLVGSPAITVSSCTGCAPAIIDSATGAARAQTLTTARTIWGQSFDGSANVTAAPTFGAGATVSSGQTLTLTGSTITGLTAASVGSGAFPSGTYSFTGATSLTGGAGNMTIQAGTGNSRTLTLQGTTSTGTATTIATLSTNTTTSSWTGGLGTLAISPTGASSITNLQAINPSAASFTLLQLAGSDSSVFINGRHLLNKAGAAAAPAIAWNGFGNVGLWSGASDTLKVTAGSSSGPSMMVTGGLSPTWVGGAGNLTIQAGTGNSREIFIKTTTSGGTATNALRLDQTQRALFYGDALPNSDNAQDFGLSSSRWKRVYTDSVRGVGATSIIGGAGNMTILAGTGNSRTLTLQVTNAAGTPTTQMIFDGTTATCGYNCVQMAAPFMVQSGNAGTPGLAIGSTGGAFFRYGLDTLGIATGGVASLGIRGGASPTIFGGAGSMTIQAGTGNSRRLSLSTTTSSGTATTAVRFNEMQQSLFIDGPATNPAISFASDSTMGFRKATTTSLRAVLAGVDRWSFGNGFNGSLASYQTRGGAGDATLPGFSFNTDTTKGIYFYNTDTLGFTTGGTKRLLIANQGATNTGDVALCVTTTGVTGVIRQGATCGTSSAKAKTSIGSIFNPIEKTMALKPVSYSYIPGMYGERHEYGMTAEATAAVDSTLVFLAPDDSKLPNGQVVKKGDPVNLNDRALLALLFATVQEQQRQIDSLKAMMRKKP